MFFSEDFLRRHADSIQATGRYARWNGHVGAVTPDGDCIFLRPDKSCAVYEDRPDVCREYGRIVELPCPYFKANGEPRNREEVRRMKKMIRTMEHLAKKGMLKELHTGIDRDGVTA
ncbi:MAG: Flagellin N-methylase [Methanocella sp. PtaU1.Bin125]|nr:MAG: Flagellin N-methylase [Methanocella sp. PtaU1.Bin125]